MSAQHTRGRLTHAPQVGRPGHCHLAQIFDADGQSLACLDSTVDPEFATQRARRLVACWNACEGLSTEALEADGNLGNGWRLATYATRDAIAQRDELLEVLERLTHYAECQVAAFSSGRPSLDMTLFPRLCADARAAIAKVKGGAS